MADWVSITEAASRLSALGDRVSRSTLSRYVSRYAEALEVKVAGRETLVDFDDLVRHRSENINVSAAVETPARVAELPARQGQAEASARERTAKAGLSELELARELKLTTIVSEVEAAAINAVTLMTTSLDQAVETSAEQLALRYGWDVLKVRKSLKDFSRHGLEIFAAEIARAVDAMRAGGGAPPETKQ